jgi:hypothetical protein
VEAGGAPRGDAARASASSQPDGDHGGSVEPLLHGAARVTVDGHPICAVCGRGVVPTGPGRWRHLDEGERFPERSPWLSPTPAELRRCATYEQFAATYPWAVRSDDGGRFTTTPGQWREGLRRLGAYEAALRATGVPRTLAAGENPYLAIVELLSAPQPEPETADEALAVAWQQPYWGLPFGLAQMLGLAERRRELVQLFAWAIPTPPALELLARHGPIVECGAGTGYWTALLRARGVDALAYDVEPPGGGDNAFHRAARATWTDVGRASAVEAVRRHRERTLLLCWPPLDDDAASYDALLAYRGEVFLYVGEPGGNAGSVRFHRELELNWEPVETVELPRWPRLEDRVVVFRRRPVRRPQAARDRCPECGAFVPTGTIGRCERCVARRPPALALRVGRHRMEYSAGQLEAMPRPLRLALEASPQRIR